MIVSVSFSFSQDDLKTKAEAYLEDGETLSESIVFMVEGKTFNVFFYLKNDEPTGAILFENGKIVLDEIKYKKIVEIALLIKDENLRESLIELEKIVKELKPRMERIEDYQIEIRNFLYDEPIIYFSKAKFGFLEEDQELYLKEFLNDTEMFPKMTELGKELLLDHSEILGRKLQKFELINENLIWKNKNIILGKDESKKVDFVIENKNQIANSLNGLQEMINVAVEEDSKKECFSNVFSLIFIKSLSDKRTGNWRGCMALIEFILTNGMMSKMKEEYQLGDDVVIYYHLKYSLFNLPEDKKNLLEPININIKNIESSLNELDLTQLFAQTLAQDFFSTRVPPRIEFTMDVPKKGLIGEPFLITLKLKNTGETPALNLEIIGKLGTSEIYTTREVIEVGVEETLTLEFETKDLESGLNSLEVRVKYEGIYGEFEERSEIEVEFSKPVSINTTLFLLAFILLLLIKKVSR